MDILGEKSLLIAHKRTRDLKRFVDPQVQDSVDIICLDTTLRTNISKWYMFMNRVDSKSYIIQHFCTFAHVAAHMRCMLSRSLAKKILRKSNPKDHSRNI